MIFFDILYLFNSYVIYLSKLFLFILGFCSICSSIFIISAKNPMHAIFALIMTFIFIVMIMIGYLKCEFLSIIFLIVYIGAVSILFLFVVMLLNIKNIDLSDKFFNYLPVGIVISFLFLIEFYVYIYWGFNIEFSNLKIFYTYYNYINIIDANNTDIEIISQLLYEEYALLFILAALLLLIAMIGAIILTLKLNINIKKQYITFQVYRQVLLKVKNN